jgi:cytochrome c oxidase subunit 3
VSITLGFLALIMATLVVWLVRQTINVRPWVAQTEVAVAPPSGVADVPAVKIGLVVFLAVVTSLFALCISAYAMRMEYPDWQRLPEPNILWWNTGILILSSVGLQWASSAVRRGNAGAVRFALLVGGVCAVGFVAGQLVAWQELSASGYLVASNPANAFFYMITALHGLHLLGGLVAWGRTAIKVWRPEFELADVRVSVEVCTLYWHFLLVVWLVLFGLLLST